ncbi:MAG: PIG-L deacetylase family protein [Candidatus Thorarchaeota archaeon]
MKWNLENALVISAHTDDMELGAGGTVRQLIENGVKVKSLVFSDCRKSVDTSKFPIDVLFNECKAAAEHLGLSDLTILQTPVRAFPEHRQEILDTIYNMKKKNNFDLVLSHWHGDLHQDHRIVAEETRRAFMKTNTTVLAYEVPGNCPGFTPQVYVPISEEEVQLKIDMLQKYESQVARRGYFEIEAIKSLMGYQGNHIGAHYAEAFVQQRGIIKGFTSN